MVTRYQFIDGTIVESVVDKDGTNTQTFMDGNGNRRFDITINAQGDSSMTNFDPEGFLFYERPVKRGSEA